MAKTMTKRNVTLLTAIITTVVTTITIMPSAFADNHQARGDRGQRGEHRGQRDHARHRGAHMFKRLDTNEDGVLSLDEMLAPVSGKSEKIFNFKDSDDDGLLTLEEFTHNRRGERPDLSGIADDIVQCVSDLKEETGNENIQVPDAEHFVAPADKFAEIDTSGDGFIDLAEFTANKTAKVTTAFTNMDSDENGEVSKDEYKAALKSHWATKRAIHQCVSEILDDEEE